MLLALLLCTVPLALPFLAHGAALFVALFTLSAAPLEVAPYSAPVAPAVASAANERPAPVRVQVYPVPELRSPRASNGRFRTVRHSAAPCAYDGTVDYVNRFGTVPTTF